MNYGMAAYRQASRSALNPRDADAQCFRLLIAELTKSMGTPDLFTRNQAILKNQRLWSLIQKANAVDKGVLSQEDRLLFARMADSAQRYGIRALLDQDLSLQPLVDIASDILEGLILKHKETEVPNT